MAESADTQRYLYASVGDPDAFREEEEEEEEACRSIGQRRRMSGFGEGRGHGGPKLGLPSEGSESSQEPRAKHQRTRSLHEDVEMNGSGTESHGNESHGNESHGNESLGSSNGNCKDSALLESSGSNKRSGSAQALLGFSH